MNACLDTHMCACAGQNACLIDAALIGLSEEVLRPIPAATRRTMGADTYINVHDITVHAHAPHYSCTDPGISGKKQGCEQAKEEGRFPAHQP